MHLDFVIEPGNPFKKGQKLLMERLHFALDTFALILQDRDDRALLGLEIFNMLVEFFLSGFM